MARLPLEGIRILDFTVVYAGPYAAMFMGDYGAEVIRVESTHHFPPTTRGQYARPVKGIAVGYPNEDPGDRPWNRYATFNGVGRNKLSMTVDITRPEGMEILKRLVRISDVVIENYVPSVMDKLGITYDMLRKEKPDIIFCKMSAYGDTGPYRDYRAMAVSIGPYSGETSLRGYTDMDPSAIPGTVAADPAEGVTAVFAIVAALDHRDRTGKGQIIDMCLSENFITYFPQALMDYSMNGRVRGTLGNRDPVAAPCGNFRCQGQDRWVSIAVYTDEQWAGFCRAVAQEWVRDERFKDSLSRHKHQDALEPLVESWTLQHDYYEVMHLLQKEGVPAGPVLDDAAAFQDPQLKARGYFVEESSPDTGTYLYPGFMARMKNAPLSVRQGPVMLGEHNDYLYKQVLGISDAEYEKLVETGHIGMEYTEDVQ